MDYFFAEPKNWILIGLALFFAVVFYAGAHTIIFKSLDDRAAAIRDELGRAAALRHEAEELLRQYAARKNAAEADAARIVAQAQADADSIRREAERELAADLQRRERQMEERIARAERLAADHVIDEAEKQRCPRLEQIGPVQSPRQQHHQAKGRQQRHRCLERDQRDQRRQYDRQRGKPARAL